MRRFMAIWTTALSSMRGTSSVLAAPSLWPGSASPFTVPGAVSSSDVVRVNGSMDELIAELHARNMDGLEARLEFEAWADSR